MDQRSRSRTTKALLLWLVWQGLVSPSLAMGDPTPGENQVLVFYPKGDCGTGWLDIEVYDRDVRVWLSHAEHPRIATDSCQVEDPGILLQELRVRCADPANRARVSSWRVGAEVFKPVAADKCKKE